MRSVRCPISANVRIDGSALMTSAPRYGLCNMHYRPSATAVLMFGDAATVC